MQKTTKSAVLSLALSLAVLLTQSSQAAAQDQEEGAVELDGPSPAAEPAAPAETAATQEPAPPPVDEPASDEAGASGGGGNPGNLRVFAGARLGVGGGFRAPDSKFIAAARITPGFAVGADYVLHRYFAIGGETRFDWASLNERDKYMFWSLLVKPRARHQLKQLPLELYADVAAGLSIANAGPSNETGKVSGALGLGAGANYFFGNHWALNVELGWTWHWLRFDRKVPGNGPPQGINGVPALVSQSFDARFGQMALGVNLIYAL